MFLNFIKDNLKWLSVGGMLTFSSCLGQTFFISIFAAQIMDSFSLSDGDWGRIYALGTFASGILMIFAGGLADRFRVRKLAVIFLIAIAVITLAMAINPYAALLPILIFGLRFTGQGMLSHIGLIAMARWFTANRGKAVSIATLGFAIGEAFLPVIFAGLITIFFWRDVWIASAIIPILFIPLILKFLKTERTPQSIAAQTSSTGIGDKHWTRMNVIRHPLFWLLVPLILSPSAWGTALFFQQVHLAQVKGWSHVEFAALFPIYTFTSIIFSLVAGWAVDRFGARLLMAIYLIPMIFAFLVFQTADTLLIAAIGMVLIGVMQGANATVPVAFWSEVYGTKHIGAIKALAVGVMVFGSALGPAITGIYIDKGFDFPAQMPAISLSVLIATALAAFGVWRYSR
ncbi:MAG: MFS transporter [Pseudomonadota bacterium]